MNGIDPVMRLMKGFEMTRLIRATCCAVAVCATAVHADGQVLLIPGDSSPSIQVLEGEDLQLQLFLQSVDPTTSLIGANLKVSIVENSIAVNYDGTGSVFPGGLNVAGGLVGDQDLSIASFAPATVDDSGTDLLGTLTIDSSTLSNGEQFTIDFTGTVFSDTSGFDVESLPDPVLVTIIPEPTSLALIGLGGLLLVRRRR